LRRRITALLVLATLVLGACEARFDAVLNVTADESGDFALELSLDEELRQLLEEQGGEQFLAFEDQLGEVPDGWTSAPLTEGEFRGVRVATTFDDLEHLDQRLQALEGQLAASELSLPAAFDSLSLTHDGRDFAFRADLRSATEGLEQFEGQEVGGLGIAEIIDTIFTIRFIVALPGTIEMHNADSVSENTLTWEISTTDTVQVLQATSVADRTTSIWSLLGVVLVVAVVVAGAASVIVRSRRRRAQELEATRLVDAGQD
jgi:hypothetical protein